MMGISQEMVALISGIAFQPIMNRFTAKLRQNSHLIHRHSSPFRMNKIVGQPIRTGHMGPPKLTIDPQPRFIKMDLGEFTSID